MPNMFGIFEDERVAVFIDSQHVNSVTVALGTQFDYKALAEYFEESTHFVRPYFYALVPREGFNPIQGLLDFISFHGYTVQAKQVARHEDDQGRARVYGSYQVEMAVDLITNTTNVHHVVLFGGDGDIIPAVKELKSRGIRVTVVGGEGQTSMDLRKTADRFIPFEKINDRFTRKPREPREQEPVA